MIDDATQPITNLISQALGKYEIVREIGRGAMGSVYLGHDPFADRDVAIKVAHPDTGQDERVRQKLRKLFFNEAKAAGMMKHPNIISVYDAGVERNIWHMVMEYVPGGFTLHDFCQPSRLLPLEDVVDIILKCAGAVDYAHRRGVVHRDIKPKNILLTEDRDVKIGDFGIALITHPDMAETQVQGQMGSPLYMSPEQLQGEQITNQTDIFSIGVVMYQLLTGKHPFLAETLPAITHNICHCAHVPVAELRAETPPILAHVVDRTLKKHPAGRYRMGLDLVGDLELVFDEVKYSEPGMSGSDKFDLVKNLAFFNTFQEAEMWEMINAGIWEEYAPGETIITEGDGDTAFYILVSGEVTVRKGNAEVAVLPAGAAFGEMSYVTGESRTATVLARAHVTVMKLRPALIERTSPNCQLRFQQVFLRTMADRLSRTTALLSEAHMARGAVPGRAG